MSRIEPAFPSLPPLPFVARNLPRLVQAARGLRVIDLACGSGRHTRLVLEAGLPVLAVDRDLSGLARDSTLAGAAGLTMMALDLEAEDPWPFPPGSFGAAIVTNYLYRPRLEEIFRLVAPGGMVLYETFGLGQARHGRPSNPDFLARPGELAAAARAAGLSLLEEHFGFTDGAVRTGVLAIMEEGRCAG